MSNVLDNLTHFRLDVDSGRGRPVEQGDGRPRQEAGEKQGSTATRACQVWTYLPLLLPVYGAFLSLYGGMHWTHSSYALHA